MLATTGAVTVTSVETVQLASTTSTTWCGTCCNLGESGSVEVESEVALTELLLRVNGNALESCMWCDDGGWIVPLGEGIGFCLSDSSGGIHAPLQTTCEGHGFFHGPAEVVHALGPDFEPVDPLPTVNVP